MHWVFYCCWCLFRSSADTQGCHLQTILGWVGLGGSPNPLQGHGRVTSCCPRCSRLALGSVHPRMAFPGSAQEFGALSGICTLNCAAQAGFRNSWHSNHPTLPVQLFGTGAHCPQGKGFASPGQKSGIEPSHEGRGSKKGESQGNAEFQELLQGKLSNF